MTQKEAVIQTLERLGGIATLGTLYQEVFRITECIWKTKTPYASIRWIVQFAPEIYKIKPGLWALESHRKKLESNGIFEQTEKNKESVEVKNFNHSYYFQIEREEIIKRCHNEFIIYSTFFYIKCARL